MTISTHMDGLTLAEGWIEKESTGKASFEDVSVDVSVFGLE